MATPELTPPPGYGRLVPLDRHRHRGVAAPAGSAAFAAKLNAIPVFAAEFIPAARDYPLVFLRDSAHGHLVPVIVTGLEPHNRFIDADSRWRDGCYVPAYVRSYPFVSIPVRRGGNGHSEAVVCVDETALAPSDEPYFDREGNGTERWYSHERLLKAADTGRLQTAALCARLEELDLLEPFEAQHIPKDRAPQRLRGMLRVAEARLNALDAAAIQDLMTHGQLARIYAHLMSLDNFLRLA